MNLTESNISHEYTIQQEQQNNHLLFQIITLTPGTKQLLLNISIIFTKI